MSVQHRLADDPGVGTGVILFRQAQAGCRDSLNELMERHDGLVHAVVRRQVLGDLSYAEAVQTGRIGLWRAILGYDPDRGWTFSTYAWPSITRHIWRAVKKDVADEGHRQSAWTTRSRVDGLPSLSTVAFSFPSAKALDPAVIWEATAVWGVLYNLVKRLPRRLRYIIVARYGLAGCRVALYREIGARLHLSRERVRQLHTEALVWLRHPAFACLPGLNPCASCLCHFHTSGPSLICCMSLLTFSG